MPARLIPYLVGRHWQKALSIFCLTLLAVAAVLVPPLVSDAFSQSSSSAATSSVGKGTSGAASPEQALANGALQHRKIGNSGPADVTHGEQIALGKTGCQAGQVCGCFQCHGVRGQGNPGAGFPRIGSQGYLYLYQALHNFASGHRKSDIMRPIASHLSDNEMRDVAAYYASLKPAHQGMENAAASKHNPTFEMLQQGGVLAAEGSAKVGVQACQDCHGPAGVGLPPVYPFLAGQYANYLKDQLHAFKSGKRQGDEFEIMQDIARRLSDKQIEAVSDYYAAIRPQPSVTQTKLGPAVQIGAPLGPQHGAPQAPSNGQGQKQ